MPRPANAGSTDRRKNEPSVRRPEDKSGCCRSPRLGSSTLGPTTTKSGNNAVLRASRVFLAYRLYIRHHGIVTKKPREGFRT
jgi:hypothetical protein